MTQPTDKAELLNCPFCGETTHIRPFDLCDETTCITCDNCNAQGGYYGGTDSTSEAEAIAFWNRRHQTKAAQDVLAERCRQIEVEGWTSAHDDAGNMRDLSKAAACYAVGEMIHDATTDDTLWPWDEKWWKPSDRRRNLVKAGALILAEIERLDRRAPTDTKGEG